MEKEVFFERQKKAAQALAEKGIYAAVIKDFEGCRNSSLRYLTGHPTDAAFFIFADGKTILVPWDVNLAKQYAFSGEIIPYTDFDRNFIKAAISVFENKGAGEAVLDFSSAFTWIEVTKLKKALSGFKTQCLEDGGIDSIVMKARLIKDKSEFALYRTGAEITNTIIDKLEELVVPALTNASSLSETDVALYIEKLAREMGTEGTSFDTIVSSPKRSWGIHPYPSFSSCSITGEGLTIVDFGIRYKGYATDVTVTFAGRKLTKKQAEMVSLVKEASQLAQAMIKPGIPVSQPAEAVQSFLSSHRYTMPHGLGHGIGLDVHEPPFLKAGSSGMIFEEGMIFTIEPGLYDPKEGGVRLENDFAVTKTGCKKITNSRVIQPQSE